MIEGPSLPPVVKKLGVVSFFNDLASEMVYPLLPNLITSQLGAPALALGALDGISDAVSAVVKLVSGRLADRARLRGPLVIGGYCIAAVVRPAMGWASTVWQVIALRATDRMGKGVRNPPRDAVIADATDATLRGRAFGFHRAMDHAGAVVGPLIAWLLIASMSMDPTDVITWSVVPGLLAATVATVAMRGLAMPAQSSATDMSAPPERSAAAAPSRPTLILIVLFAFSRVPETLFLLRLQDLGVTVALIPIAWALLHIVRSVSSYPGGWLSDRLGPRITMIAGWTVYGTVCTGFGMTQSTLTAGLWFLGLGLATSLTESPERAFIAASAPIQRGTRFGIYHALVGIAALPGGLMFGLIYTKSGGALTVLVSAALSMMLAAAGFVSKR